MSAPRHVGSLGTEVRARRRSAHHEVHPLLTVDRQPVERQSAALLTRVADTLGVTNRKRLYTVLSRPPADDPGPPPPTPVV